MKKMILLCSIMLTGCGDSEEKMVGHWKADPCRDNILCSFTVEKKTNALSDYYVTFDEDQGLFGVSEGPIVKGNGNTYVLHVQIGQITFQFKNGKLYTEKGDEFKKDK